MNDAVEVERSAVRTWLLALLGIPFMLLGADMFLQQKLIGRLGEWIYGAEPLPAFENRDRVLAALMLVVGACLTLWGLKELLVPRKVLVGDETGIRAALAGPFRRAVAIPWSDVVDVRHGVAGEEGDRRPVLDIEVTDPSRLPFQLWGARWSGAEIVIDATGWSPAADEVAASLSRLRGSHPTGDPGP